MGQIMLYQKPSLFPSLTTSMNHPCDRGSRIVVPVSLAQKLRSPTKREKKKSYRVDKNNNSIHITWFTILCHSHSCLPKRYEVPCKRKPFFL